MSPLRPVLFLLAAIAALAAAAAPALAASSTDVDARPTPLTFALTGAPPTCAAPADMNGTTMATVARKLIADPSAVVKQFEKSDLGANDSIGPLFSWLTFLSFAARPVPVIGVCDPALAASATPAGTFTGTAASPPGSDAVGPGLRLRSGSLGSASSAAAVGDHFVLPAVSAASTVDVVVHTSGGAAPTRLGPFPSVPVSAQIQGTPAAPLVTVQLADGSTTAATVQAPPAVATTTTALIKRGKRTSVALKLRTTPGAMATVITPEKRHTDSMDDRLAGFDERGQLKVANASGSVNVRASKLDPTDHALALLVIDPDRRTTVEQSCTLTWKKKTLRRVKCSTPSSAPKNISKLLPAAPGTGTLARASTQRANRLLGALAESAPDGAPLATRAAVAAAPIGTSAVLKLTRKDGEAFDNFDPDESSAGALFGDVTGDGKPDFSLGDGLETPVQLLMSQGTGWKSVAIKTDNVVYPEFKALPDLTGDGVDELWFRDELNDTSRILSGRRDWSSSPPMTLDLRGSGLDAGDLAPVGGSDDDSGPLALPDTTGDGRAEFGVSATGGLAVFASQSIPLGMRPVLPELLLGNLAPSEEALTSLGPKTATGPLTATVQSRSASEDVTFAPKDAKRTTWAVSVRRLLTTPSVGYSAPSAEVALTGEPSDIVLDAPSGETAVITSPHTCKSRADCIHRIYRLGADGQLLGTLAIRTTASLTLAFTDDGPDADTRPELAFRDEYASSTDKAKGPGLGGTIGLWPSASGSPTAATLPVLTSNGTPLTAAGVLESWTSAAGQRFIATYLVHGKGAKLSFTLAVLDHLG